ncbi:hypothetical protein JCM24511_04906 [Saitozyma sp. JCM 24511]|nr:hypothetical protein JCM24511_04906 [Saitozyma sp. JCM 24511]
MSNPSNIPDSNPDAGPSSPAPPPAADTSADHPMSESANGTEQAPGGTSLPNGADASQSQTQSHPRTDAQAARGTSPPPLDSSSAFAARRAEETARRDRSLAEFLVMLDGYKPLIPEEVTEYYLQRAGFDCSDPRLKRLLSLSAQKFISDLSRDAFQYAKLRVNGTAVGRGRPAAGVDRNRVVLTMDDLSLALSEHGVNVKKPDYCE